MELFRPHKDLKNWVPDKLGVPTKLHGVDFYSVNIDNGLALPVGLVERGMLSGQPTQPDVNHRNLNLSSFENETRNSQNVLQPPLVHSMVLPDSTTSFSNGDHMSVHFYEIVEGEAPTPAQRLLSGNHFTIPLSNGDFFTGSGNIKDRYSKPVSNRAVKRFLRFFGLKWSKNKKKNSEVGNEEPVSLEVLASLTKLIDQSLTTEDDFKAMLEEFNLEGLFAYDKRFCLEQNRLHFFTLLNSYTPLRLSVFDGKHRVFGIMNFCIGIYRISDVMPVNGPPFKAFQNVKSFAGIPREKVTYEEMQCFKPQILCVGQPTDQGLSLVESYQVLYTFGFNKTSGNDYSVKDSFASLMQELCTFMDSKGLASAITPLTYERFWENEADWVESNGLEVANIINKFVLAKQKHKSFKSAGAADWEQSFSEIKNLLKDHSYPLGSNANSKIGGLSETVKPIMTLLKYCLPAPGFYNALKFFLQQPHPKYPQNPMTLAAKSHMISQKCMTRTVLGCISGGARAVFNKTVMERKLMQVIRSANHSHDLDEDIKDKYPYFPSYAKEKSRPKIPFPNANNRKLAETRYGMKEFGASRDKLEFAIFQIMVTDAITTINTFGWNPKYKCPAMTNPEDDRHRPNQLLDLYMK